MHCLRCGGNVHSYLRSGITIEQCEDCRGIFLDAGELERLIEAEGGGWSGRVGSPWPDPVERGEPMSSVAVDASRRFPAPGPSGALGQPAEAE